MGVQHLHPQNTKVQERGGLPFPQPRPRCSAFPPPLLPPQWLTYLSLLESSMPWRKGECVSEGKVICPASPSPTTC